MHAQVTDEMVDAAQRELPGVWNRERVRRALVAGINAMPQPSLQPDLSNLTPEELAQFEAELDATAGQPCLILNSPTLNPALARPLELGTLSAAARRLRVARSTVTGWVENRATNGMPEPVDGKVYDLVQLEAWHRQWKANG